LLEVRSWRLETHQQMVSIYKYFSTAASILLFLFVQLFLNPLRSELGALGIKERDENSILVAITILSLAILILILNLLLDRVNKIQLGKFLLSVSIISTVSCVISLVYWINS
jgi:hypothetical protein